MVKRERRSDDAPESRVVRVRREPSDSSGDDDGGRRIDRLPKELLVMTMRYLVDREVVCSTMLSCKTFFEAARCSITTIAVKSEAARGDEHYGHVIGGVGGFMEFVERSAGVPDDDEEEEEDGFPFLALSQMFPHIASIHLPTVNGVEDISALSSWTSLTYLCLSGTSVRELDALLQCPMLSCLRIDDTRVRELPALPSITAIDVSNTRIRSIESIASPHLHTLVMLEMQYEELIDKRCLRACSALQVLQFSGENASKLLANTAELPSMIWLSLSLCYEDSLAMAAGLQAASWSHLDTLVLDSCSSGPVLPPSIVPLAMLQNLRVLYLRDFQGLDEFARIGGSLSSGNEYALEWLDVSETSARNDISHLSCFKRLKGIALEEMASTDLDNPLHLTALGSLPELQFVRLRGTFVSSLLPLASCPNLIDVVISGRELCLDHSISSSISNHLRYQDELTKVSHRYDGVWPSRNPDWALLGSPVQS